MRLDAALGRFPIAIAPDAELRRYTVHDADELFVLVEANRERLNTWMPWVEGTRSVENTRAWIAQHLEDLEGVGLSVAGHLAGSVGMSTDPFGTVGEIGYWVDLGHEGRGLVTASVRALMDLGFRDLGLHRIAIRAGVDNLRSRAIPEHLGFTREGVLRGEGRGSDGHGFYDLVVYGILEDEWRPA